MADFGMARSIRQTPQVQTSRPIVSGSKYHHSTDPNKRD